jgi:hypothetical protein
MWNLLTKCSLFIFITGVAYAGVMPDPPTVDDSKATLKYFKTIHDNMNNLTVVTQDPNHNRNGRYGDMVIYKNGATFTVKICVTEPSGTGWQ